MNNNKNKIPSGNVTFLFTDIEGSTKLSQDFPELLNAVLERHNEILRNAVESNNGFIFKIIGDAFCCAFEIAEDAVKAAVEIQTDLGNEKWDEAVIKIRIGIHSGKAEWNGTDYMGYITLARAVRVMSSAYGEQILISNDAYLLCIKSAKDGPVASFRDLGERRLKDVIQPIRLFQVLAKGLREDFPPLKTLDARPNNLPVQLTSFIGREKPIGDVKKLSGKTHLLTVIGAGGSGKTRLTLQAAAEMIDEFANGVFIVELAPVSDPALIMQKIMTSLGIKEESGISLFDSVVSYLREKELLLIMDNCEHLVKDCAEIAENLLMNCSKLKILATSREALNCYGEQTYKIPMLSTPGNFNDKDQKDHKDLYKYESSFLFLERVYSANPDFQINEIKAAAIAEICRHLDGIPLAIELAAASSKYLSVENIRKRLDDRFKILTGGKRTALPKHQTLKALIDWSYELLNDKERLLWKRLSVFKGGWDMEKAEEICSDQKISRKEILELHGCLVEKSIINFNLKTERYSILETLKKYGEDKLREDNELSDMLNKHLTFFKNYSDTAESRLYGSEIFLWLDKLESDHLNFQSAIEWSVNGGDKETGAGLAVSLWRFWDIRGYYSTGIRYIYEILKNENEISRTVTGKLYLYAAQLARFKGDYDRSREYFNQSLKINNQLQDKLMIASSLNGLGNIEFDLDNYENAKDFYEKALSLRREAADLISISKSLNNLGNLSFRRDDLDEGKKYYLESLELARKLGDKRAMASSLHNLSNLTFETGNFEKGKQYSEESLLLRKEIGDKLGIAESLFNLGKAYFDLENYETSKSFFEDSLRLFRELEDTDDISKTLKRLGEIESVMGNFEEADSLLSESIKLSEKINNRILLAEALFESGKNSFRNKNINDSCKFFSEFIKLRSDPKNIHNTAVAMIYLLGIHESGSFQLSHIQILAAAEYSILVMDSEPKEEELILKENIKSSLLKKFGRKKFDEYYEQGKMMTLDEACNLITFPPRRIDS